MTKLKQLKKLARPLLVLVTLIIIGWLAWLIHLDHNLAERLKGKRFLPPTEYYAAPFKVRKGQSIPAHELREHLRHLGYRERQISQTLHAGDFAVYDLEQCQSQMNLTLPLNTTYCLFVRGRRRAELPQPMSDQLLVITETSTLSEIFTGNPLTPQNSGEFEPELFAQFYGDQPIIRKIVELGRVPVSCLDAIVAIEDSQFLEHPGVSLKGLARAVVRNLQAGRLVEGGSTLTQQLVKNYFLTSERTFRRKFVELFMALLLEWRWSKDEILETYLNVIYMGQNGPFQIRGLAAAAEYYFTQPIEELNLGQCSLLAALVNSPGLFNPFKNPASARQRQEKVLGRMLELQMITVPEKEQAAKLALPQQPSRALNEPAPFFVGAVQRLLRDEKIDESEGLRIFTTLNLRAQEAAQKSVSETLNQLENQYASLQNQKKKGHSLEGLFLSADLDSAEIISIVGGRNYRQSQFNRAVDGHRQVGSLMKPFVFLAALESQDENGQPYTPVSPILDEPFTHSYSSQKWSPQNYDHRYHGRVPLFFALKNSLNSATARLGIAVGLEAVLDVGRRAGLTSPITPLPSLTLGAYELYPREILQAYSTLATMGTYRPLRLVRQITRLDGRVVYASEERAEPRFAPAAAAELVGMLKQTVDAGTAAQIRSTFRFTYPAAGKTGTTSDTKDAWFAGFTPHHVAVAWVGYDNNTPHGLTGASAAVPIWSRYMTSYYAQVYPQQDFLWPADAIQIVLSPQDQQTLGVPPATNSASAPIELIFRKGHEPIR